MRRPGGRGAQTHRTASVSVSAAAYRWPMRESLEPVNFLRPGLVDYRLAWQQQKQVARARIDDLVGDTVYLLEHPAVYTAGRRTQPEDLPTDATPVVEVDRGGRITWHGPGQLVAYPIIKLAEKMFVVGYVRRLEDAIIAVCDDLGLQTDRIKGRTGVWLPAGNGRPERKVAAIGVRIAKGVTTHGLAINCNPDLAEFDRIVPCGISDAGVTSLTAELNREVTVKEVIPLMENRLRQAFDGQLPVRQSQENAVAPSRDGGISLHLASAIGGQHAMQNG